MYVHTTPWTRMTTTSKLQFQKFRKTAIQVPWDWNSKLLNLHDMLWSSAAGCFMWPFGHLSDPFCSYIIGLWGFQFTDVQQMTNTQEQQKHVVQMGPHMQKTKKRTPGNRKTKKWRRVPKNSSGSPEESKNPVNADSDSWNPLELPEMKRQLQLPDGFSIPRRLSSKIDGFTVPRRLSAIKWTAVSSNGCEHNEIECTHFLVQNCCGSCSLDLKQNSELTTVALLKITSFSAQV